MKKSILCLFAAVLFFNAAAFAAPAPGLESQSSFRKYWKVESESPDYSVSLRDGVCEISAPKGLTLWYREKMSGNVVIEYDACVLDGKEGDRVSDLNCFWMASDPGAKDVFKNLDKRGGVFANAASMKLYYVGYGGNSNTTTRFRRYDGRPDPALVREYTDGDHLLKPNHWYHIKLVSADGRVQYWIDGERLFDYADSDPYKEGWFGFRTTASRTAIRNFSYSATPPAPFSEAPLHWIGETPARDEAVKFIAAFRQSFEVLAACGFKKEIPSIEFLARGAGHWVKEHFQPDQAPRIEDTVD